MSPRQSPGTAKCRIWWDTNIQAYHVSTPYNSQFVEALKRLIPASDRSFDDINKLWLITERFYEPVRKLATAIWPNPGEVAIIDRAQAEQSTAPSAVIATPLNDLCKRFVELLPFDAANAAYRKAAVELHPDRGGDMNKMTELNVLWNRIKKEVYKQ